MVRIHQVMLAKDLESVNGGRLGTDPLVIKKVLKETSWTRSMLNHNLDGENRSAFALATMVSYVLFS